MAYASSSDVTTRYSNAELLIVADRDGSGTADTGIVTQALDDASSVIDAYLAAAYTLPLASTPSVLTTLCIDIAMYRMAENAGAMTDERRRRFEDALKMLEHFSDGTAKLVIGTTQTNFGNSIKTATESRDWSRTLTRGLF